MKTIRRRQSRKATGKYADSIRELRTRMGGIGPDRKPLVSQTEFAQILEVAPITCSRWETSKQDPPRPVLERLALLACNMACPDLELIFRADEPTETTIMDKERNIGQLWMCLARWIAVGEGQRDTPLYRQIHRIGQVIFEVSRQIVQAEAATTGKRDLAREALLAEMSRLLQSIHNDEHKFCSILPSVASVSRVFGLPLYSDGEPDMALIDVLKQRREEQQAQQTQEDQK